MKFETRTLVEAESGISLVRDGKTETLALGPAGDAQLNSRGEAATLTAPMVFVGYGLVIPEANYDDLAGLDLQGKSGGVCECAGSGGGFGQSEIALLFGRGALGRASGKPVRWGWRLLPIRGCLRRMPRRGPAADRAGRGGRGVRAAAAARDESGRPGTE